MLHQNINTVLFDLDGTLLDSAPDLANALNNTLAKLGKPPIQHSAIREVVSLGGEAMVKLCFGITPSHKNYKKIHGDFRADYAENICVDTVMFPGIAELLTHIESKGFQWGIVTDKPEYLTLKVLKKIGLIDRAACIISGDSIPFRKPSPEPLLHACKLINTKPENCIYIGDAERDIQAANSANIYSIAALYGYISKDVDPKSWQAKYYINHPKELILNHII